MNTATRPAVVPVAQRHCPKLAFVGIGWIGLLRMQALLAQDCATVCAVYDPCANAAARAAEQSTGITINACFDDLLKSEADGLVIATPSALHAEQAIRALNHGKAVFCQKPLARTFNETQQVVNAARAANKRLAVDFSYRHLAGVAQIGTLIESGELGDIFAANLTFHNAYGPDKPWFYDRRSAGGGCVMDLGIHLIDLVIWLLGGGQVSQLNSCLFHQGKRLDPGADEVEDFAQASFALDNTQVQLNCSWNLHAGQDAIIEACFYGTKGGACIRNVGGSFFDFEVYRFNGTDRQKLAGFPDDWGGRALTTWAQEVGIDQGYDPSIESVLQVAEVIDRIYSR